MLNRIQLALTKQPAIAVLVFITYQLTLPSAVAQAQKSNSGDGPVTVVLSLNRRVIYAGESLTASVLVENKGAAGVLLRGDIDNGTDTLTLYLRHDRHVDGPVSHFASDTFYTSNPLLANLLLRKWLALGYGKFYGTTIVLDPKDYPQLLVPGRYLIYGQYSSHGFKEQFQGFRDEMTELPFKPWEGRLESNPISIEVKQPRSAN